MPSYRAFTGDDKGQIKSVTWELPPSDSQEQARISATTIQTPDQPREPIHKLRCFRESDSESGILAAAYANGQVTQYSYASGSDELQEQCTWKEKRMNGSDRFVGLQVLPGKGWLTCTQHGRLRLSKSLGEPSTSAPPEESIASLPMRLNDMRLDPACATLAYGGDEVDLSVWDVERTFSEKPAPSSDDAAGKKRKKGKGDLLYAEIWRAKQLPNDSLSLRQPVHITSLAFLRGSQNPGPTFHIATGNKSGAVRRFDTRAARRPVANWENIAKIGGIRSVEVGQNEYELFVSDNGSNLCALDFRNGKICYSYKGLPSAPTSFSPISKTHLASVSLDRVFRLHTVYSPPAEPNAQQLKKGQVIGQEFLKSTPIAVAWDQFEVQPVVPGSDEEEDVWEGMEVRGDDSGDESSDYEKDKSVKKKRARK